MLSHRAAGTLPVVILVSAGEDEKLTGFLEVGLRSQTSANAGPRPGQLALRLDFLRRETVSCGDFAQRFGARHPSLRDIDIRALA